jgi:hypothetical protein
MHAYYFGVPGMRQLSVFRESVSWNMRIRKYIVVTILQY